MVLNCGSQLRLWLQRHGFQSLQNPHHNHISRICLQFSTNRDPDNNLKPWLLH